MRTISAEDFLIELDNDPVDMRIKLSDADCNWSVYVENPVKKLRVLLRAFQTQQAAEDFLDALDPDCNGGE